jgi:hypothetical protein
MRFILKLLIPVCSLMVGAALIALQGGCGSSSEPGPATVRGRVWFQGQPVAGGLVVFTPDADRGGSGKPVHGETGPDGAFELESEGSPHIPPGWYRVAIAPPPTGSSEWIPGQAIFPPQLRRPDRSTLIREVTPGQQHFFEFAISVGD